MTTQAEEYVAARLAKSTKGPRTVSTTIFEWANTAGIHNFADGSAMIHEMAASSDPVKCWVAFPTHVAARTALGLETLKNMAKYSSTGVNRAAAKVACQLVAMAVNTQGMKASEAAAHIAAIGETL
jgi:hypothetical protein